MAKIGPFEISTNPQNLSAFAQQVAKMAADLTFALRNLSVVDNFRREIWEGIIPANSEIAIPHRLKIVPIGYQILFDDSGVVRKGTTAWTPTSICLENPALLTDANIKVAILG